MGSACCSSDNADQQTAQAMPDANQMREQDKKTKQKYIHTYDSSSDEGENSTSKPSRDNEPSTSQSKLNDDQEPSYSNSKVGKDRVLTGFKDAIQKGNDSLVMYFVQENPDSDLLNMKFPNGDSVLHVAVRNKSYNLIVYLLSQGVSPNVQNPKNGESPLHTASRIRDERVVALLMQHNADPDITNNDYETAMSIATDLKDNDVMSVLSPTAQQIVKDINSNNNNDNNTDKEPSLYSMTTTNIANDLDDILDTANNKNKIKLKSTMQIFNDKMIEKQNNKNNNNKIIRLEEKLDSTEMKQLQQIRIVRTNPFSRLTRQNTQKTLLSMNEMVKRKSALPQLAGWLEKKKPKPPKLWQRRWVIVKDSHFLWSDKQRSINNVKDPKERSKFNGSLNLMMIQEVRPVTPSNSQRKFIIVAREQSKSKIREYLWKHATKDDRDFWVKALKQHIQHMKDMVQYLGTK